MKRTKVEVITTEGNFSFQNAVNEELTYLEDLGFTVKDIKLSVTASGGSFGCVKYSAMIIYEK